ncbi:hypothetical protein C9374_001635 [Naegleria lovaniensis]|uniref:MAPEG family protein n=1 Tax=Naegleria lovaniensis TaxID=51637 RepID=A0AA88GVW7_NAELO|nr:uncharacterized protein C9374_001635 [Naegleria lovaniensis]KAG2387303.1 hypothetical protein C9374_001635 [Naegleria lovaniensis]
MSLSLLSDQPIGIYAAGILSASNFLLGLNVSRLRMSTNKSIGVDDQDLNSPLTKAVRAHGNHAEYTPTAISLMLFMEAKQLIKSPGGHTGTRAMVVMRACMIAYVLARLSITCGLLSPNSLAKVSPFRRLGAVLNYVLGIALSVGLVTV